MKTKISSQYETAVFGGGCFWCTEAVFSRLRGVHSVVSGYTGGHAPDPTYEQVSTGSSGHVESVRVEFDPEAIEYKDLLKVFFATHDPTSENRQGADIGPQYRSVVFYLNEAQRHAAELLIAEFNREQTFGRRVVTKVERLTDFYPAEEYHRRYYEMHPAAVYCQAVISPKIAKLRQSFRHLLVE